jgi:hypothetical protein
MVCGIVPNQNENKKDQDEKSPGEENSEETFAQGGGEILRKGRWGDTRARAGYPR